MDKALQSAAAGGFMDTIGSIFTMGAQKRAATKAYNRQKDFWHMQNRYNTPSAQVQRLKDAGLNPALIYGKGQTGATGNAQGASNVQKANVQGPQLAQSAAAGAQISLVNAQRTLMNDQAEAARINAAANFRNSLTQRKKFELDKSVTPYTIQELMSRRDQQTTQAGLNISSADLNKAREKVQYKTLGLYDKQMDQLVSQTKLNESNRRLVFTKINEITQRIAMDWVNTHSRAQTASAAERQSMGQEIFEA